MPSSPFAWSARFAIGRLLLFIPGRAQTAFGFPYPNPFDPVVHAQLVVELALAAPQRMRIAVVDSGCWLREGAITVGLKGVRLPT